MILYFAYGSNMDAEQMRRRCPGARLLARVELRDHDLVFAGHSRGWGGAVASIEPCEGVHTCGLLYAVTPTCVRALDAAEGHPTVYRRTWVKIADLKVLTYVRNRHNYGLPSPRYYNQIRRAYERHGFSIDHLRPWAPGRRKAC